MISCRKYHHPPLPSPPLPLSKDSYASANLSPPTNSFYKEEKAGETNNYVSQKSFYDGKDVRAVLKDTIAEAQAAVHRMRAVTKGKGIYEARLERHIVGSIAFHFVCPRYKLTQFCAPVQEEDVHEKRSTCSSN